MSYTVKRPHSTGHYVGTYLTFYNTKFLVLGSLLKIVSSSILLSSLITFVSIAKEPLRFVVNHPGSAPYLYFDQQSNSYDGVIPEILKALIESNQLKIKYISNEIHFSRFLYT